jgi:hypothetical protein
MSVNGMHKLWRFDAKSINKAIKELGLNNENRQKYRFGTKLAAAYSTEEIETIKLYFNKKGKL